MLSNRDAGRISFPLPQRSVPDVQDFSVSFSISARLTVPSLPLNGPPVVPGGWPRRSRAGCTLSLFSRRRL